MEEQELVDVYDENKNRTGKIINRNDKDNLRGNEYTITVHCWIINSKKEILITQRSMHKSRGGKWEDTHGALRRGETSREGMKRELKEELGIDVQDDDLKFIKTLKRIKLFRDCYILLKDIPLNEFKFTDGEVMNCKYVSVDEFKEIIKRGESTFKDFSQTIFSDIDINKF